MVKKNVRLEAVKPKKIEVEKTIEEKEFEELSFQEQINRVEQKMRSIMKTGKSFNEAFEKLFSYEQETILKYQELEQQRQQAMQREKERIELEEKERIKKEFEETKNEQKLLASEEGLTVSPNKLKLFLARFKLKKIVGKAYKKGGAIIIKCYLGRGYQLIYSKKPIKFVEFKSKNEKGEEIINITRITQNKGHLHGSSIPVHFCIEGVANSFDPFKNIETDMSADSVNKLLKGEFQSGLATGLAIKPEGVHKFPTEKALIILFFVVIGALGIMGYYLMQIYELVA